MEINNITLDKDKYVYWVDQNMYLYFEIADNILNKYLCITYGFYFFCWKKYNYKIYSKKINIKDIEYNDNTNRYKCKIPIVMISKSFKSFYGEKIWMKNFIHIWTSLISKNIKITPIISYDLLKIREFGFKNIIDNKTDWNEYFEEQEWDNIYINYKLYWIFTWAFLAKILDKISINKNIYTRLLKESFFLRIWNSLINKSINQNIYKFLFILPIASYTLWLFFPLYSLLSDVFILSLWIFIFSVLLTLTLNQIYIKVLYKKIYWIKFLSKKDISNNLLNKLSNNTLNINDILYNTQMDWVDNWWNYKVRISLHSYMTTFSWIWKSVEKENSPLYWIDLFELQKKGLFYINDLKLLNNNYRNINDILLPTFKTGFINWQNKIYYKISICINSSTLPYFEKFVDIDFKNKQLF